MHQQPQETTGGIEWFAENLPKEYLGYPQYFLYHTALETEALEDTEENRRRFKAALTEHQLSQGVPIPEAKQEELTAFMESGDGTAQTERASAVLTLTARYLKQTGDLAAAQRMAVQELLERESPLRIAPMDESYFCNRELVEPDLTAFAKFAGLSSIQELTTQTPPPSTKITARSGETVTWSTYIIRASGIFFSTKCSRGGRKNKNPPRTAEALDRFKKLCGVIFMDESYFRNRELVEPDLTSFAEAAGLSSIQDLTTSRPSPDTKITVRSGETVAWSAYLNRTSGALLGTKYFRKGKKNDNPHRTSEALESLKQTAAKVDEPTSKPLQ